MVGSGNQAERKIEIMDNFLDLGRSMVPDNLFQVMMMITRMVMMMMVIMKVMMVVIILDNVLNNDVRQRSKQRGQNMRRS